MRGGTPGLVDLIDAGAFERFFIQPHPCNVCVCGGEVFLCVCDLGRGDSACAIDNVVSIAGGKG